MSPEQPNDRALSDPYLNVPAGGGQVASATVEVSCPNPACGNRASIAADQVGRYFRCRRCRTKFKAQPGSPQGPRESRPDLGPDTAFEPWWHGTDKSAGPPPSDQLPVFTPPPARIGRYEIHSRLSERTFGIVYRAYDPQLEREVVLRVVSPGLLKGQRRRERFLAAARLRHPHLLAVLDAGQEGEDFFIASAFHEGRTLADALDRGELDLRQSVRIIRQLAEALAYAHSQDFVHGAIQPDNILLDAQGDAVVTWEVEAPAEPEASGSAGASPSQVATAYLAPEQASGYRGEARPTFDQYSLGVTLYELLTGQTPFAGPQAIVRYNIIHVEPPSPRSVRRDLPPELEAICLKAMAKRPEQRYPSCQELAEDLRRYLEGEAVHARPAAWRERWRRWWRREPALAGAAGVAAVAVLLVALLALLFGLSSADHARNLALVLDDARARNAQAENHNAELKQTLEQAEARGREAGRQQARLSLDRATALAERGEIGQGMVWLTESLRLAVDAGDDDLEQVIRVNLAGWRRHLHRLSSSIAHPEPIRAAVFEANGQELFVAVGDPEDRRDKPGGWRIQYRDLLGQARQGDRPHPAAILALAYDPRRELLLTGCADGKARLWDATRPEDTPLAVLPHPGSVRAVAFNPDGTGLLTGCADGRAYLWRLSQKQLLDRVRLVRKEQNFAEPLPLEHTAGQQVQAVAFAPAGEWLLTGSGEEGKGGEIRLWEPAGRCVATLARRFAVRAVAVSPANGIIATAGGSQYQGEAQLWQRTGSTIRPLGPELAHEGEVSIAAFSPDGSRLLTAGQDRTARLWRVPDGTMIDQPLRHGRAVTVAVFSPDGRRILTESEERVLRLWEVAQEPTPLVAWNQKGEGASPVLAAVLSRDGTRLLIGGASGEQGLAQLVSRRTGTVLAEMTHDHPIRAVACNADASRFLTGGGAAGSKQGLVCLWDEKGEKLASWTHPGVVRGVAFHPDSRQFATACDDGVIRLWDGSRIGLPRPLQRQDVLAEPADNRAGATAVAYSPDGKALLSGSRDGYALVWDTESRAELQRLPHPGAVLGVAWGNDGRTLLTGCVGEARLWEWNRSSALSSRRLDLGVGAVVATGSDGRRVLTGGTDGAVRLWDATTRKPLGPPWRSAGVIVAVGFDPEGKTILAAGNKLGQQGTTWLWEAPLPVDGSPERLEEWAQVVTGLRLEGDSVSPLSQSAWEQAVQRLRVLGGPPELEAMLHQPRPRGMR